MSYAENRQEILDRLYWQKGPCCAGCDWWDHMTSKAGSCTRHAPVSGRERWDMLGISGCSLRLQSGHVVTAAAHHCGDFKDEFDWSSLPLTYQLRVGVPRTLPPSGKL